MTVMIPMLVQEATTNNETETLGYKLLKTYTGPPSYSTILRWMHILKFTYCTKRKSYMVDGHEHLSQCKHRDWFTNEYIRILEPRCHRWVQMTLNEFDNLPERKDILAKGYSYTGIAGAQMIELHVDKHECLQRYANKMHEEFGGNTSVRWSGKPLIIFVNLCTINSLLEVDNGLVILERELFFLSLMVLV